MCLSAALTGHAETLANESNAQPATPADSVHASQECFNQAWCEAPINGYVYFPGGTISIDIDIWGNPGPASWRLVDGAGNALCYTGFTVQDPGRSWTCNVGAGDVKLRVDADTTVGRHFALALRW